MTPLTGWRAIVPTDWRHSCVKLCQVTDILQEEILILDQMIYKFHKGDRVYVVCIEFPWLIQKTDETERGERWGSHATKVPGQTWTANVAGHGPYLTCRPPKQPHVHMFPFSFYVLHSQMVYYLVSHTRVLTSVWFFLVFCALCMLLQQPVTLNRNEQIKTMNKRGVIFLHLHITMCLEHTWSFARLAYRSQTGKNCGVKLMRKKKSPVVPILKYTQARRNSPEIPTFSVT